MKNGKYLIRFGLVCFLIFIILSIGTFYYVVGGNGCGGFDVPFYCSNSVGFPWIIFIVCFIPVGLLSLILGLIDKVKKK